MFSRNNCVQTARGIWEILTKCLLVDSMKNRMPPALSFKVWVEQSVILKKIPNVHKRRVPLLSKMESRSEAKQN